MTPEGLGGWMNGWMDEWMDEVGRWMNRQVDVRLGWNHSIPHSPIHRASSGEGTSLQHQGVSAGPGAVLSQRPGVSCGQKAKTECQ